MYEKCLMLVLLSCHVSISYGNERDAKMINSFDSARKHPISMKVLYLNPPNVQHYEKVRNVSDKSNRKFKREPADNVKGELLPQSRKDINNIKQLKFHGKNRPSTEEFSAENSSEKTSYQSPAKASQRNDYYEKPSRKNKIQNHKKNNNVEDIPPYVPDDSPFYPLMKPSPINVMPTQPPSFDTVRNYVQYLKMRQQKFFSDFKDDEEPLAEIKSSQPYEGEIDYFKQREQELAREEQLRNQFSPVNYIKNVQSREDTEHPYTDDETSSNESEIITNNNENEQQQEEENADINRAVTADDDDYAVNSNEYNNDNHYADYADETIEENIEESKKKENFVPFRLYAQVRHVEADHHEKPKKSNVREKVSLAKKNIYYKEEGYEDKNYDHGAEKIDYDFKEKRNKKPRRSKRSTDEDIDVSQLPVALAYFKKSEIPQLTGEKLFKHLDELIKNSSIYLPDEDDVTRPIRLKSLKALQKYPNYSTLPEDSISKLSAHRYSENLKNYPKQHRESIYGYKNTKECEEITEDIDPAPEDIEEKTKFNNSPKRLNNLGDKIQCYREKYFGKDPFDNPLFREDEYVEATIPIPVNHNLPRQANPLITVYDDVINNIRSGILNEFKQKREAEDVFKAASEQIAIRAKELEIPNYSSVVGVSQLPIFNINTFLPKFKGSISKYSDEDDSNEAIQTNLSLEDQQLDPPREQIKNTNVIEKPKVKRNNKTRNKKKKIKTLNQVPETPPKPISSVIKNVQPPKLIKAGSQKFRRFIPQNTVVYPTKHITAYYSQAPQSSGKTAYRFKFL